MLTAGVPLGRWRAAPCLLKALSGITHLDKWHITIYGGFRRVSAQNPARLAIRRGAYTIR